MGSDDFMSRVVLSRLADELEMTEESVNHYYDLFVLAGFDEIYDFESLLKIYNKGTEINDVPFIQYLKVLQGTSN